MQLLCKCKWIFCLAIHLLSKPMVFMVCGYIPCLVTLNINYFKTDFSSNGVVGVMVDKLKCGDRGKMSDSAELHLDSLMMGHPAEAKTSNSSMILK